ncbi:rh2.1 [macacine betaherpesvirus 3]|uniref:Rh2.1 n=1 Tax=Rhesus cytomegalovirus (strain 68-1) TaxID=47929 RepID=Q2FAX3_RHCM6|nr:rh2.1 [macacine betaherpesvirus 3]
MRNSGNATIPKTTWNTAFSSQLRRTASTTLSRAAALVAIHPLPALILTATPTTTKTPYPSHLTVTSLPMKPASILHPKMTLILLPPLPRQKPLACDHINSIYFNKYKS